MVCVCVYVNVSWPNGRLLYDVDDVDRQSIKITQTFYMQYTYAYALREWDRQRERERAAAKTISIQLYDTYTHSMSDLNM